MQIKNSAFVRLKSTWGSGRLTCLKYPNWLILLNPINPLKIHRVGHFHMVDSWGKSPCSDSSHLLLYSVHVLCTQAELDAMVVLSSGSNTAPMAALRLLGDINKAVKLWVWQIINYICGFVWKCHQIPWIVIIFITSPQKMPWNGICPSFGQTHIAKPKFGVAKFWYVYRSRTGNTPWRPTHEWRLCWSFFRQRVYLDGPWDYLTN